MDCLVSTDWLSRHLGEPDLSIVDASWFMPASGRSGHDEYLAAHIPGARFLDIDYVSQVALIAEVDENGRPTLIGSGRYIVTAPGQAEVSFSVIDEYQGKGIGGMLFRHLTEIGRSAGLRTFVAQVLSDNSAMLRVFEHSGLVVSEKREGPVVDVTIPLVRETPHLPEKGPG